MRKEFSLALHKEMSKNKDIFFLTADLGFGLFDDILKDFPYRAFNVGASEQLMLGMGVGLALKGKIPFCYSITPFLIYRGFEWIRNYIDHENIPVKLIGSGRDDDYSHDGHSHFAGDIPKVLSIFPNLKQHYPSKLPAYFVENMCKIYQPEFLSLLR